MPKFNDIDFDNWKDEDINVDSLWLYSERDKSGKHKNHYHGNFIPQIPKQLIKRFTNKNDVVFEPFMGSGTTLFECENLNRKYLGFDISPEIISYVNNNMIDSKQSEFHIEENDSTNTEISLQNINSGLKKFNKEKFQLAILHPPYWDIIKFSADTNDLSNAKTLDDFLLLMKNTIQISYDSLEKERYFAIVIGDVYKNKEIVPLSFYMLHLVKKHFKVLLKGIVIKNIEGNRGKIGIDNIWKYRAMKSDYYIFKHEYILVFKKI